MNRRQLLRALLGATVAERLIASHPVWAAGQKPVSPGIHRLRGEVMVNGQPARVGQLIHAGDRIETGPGSEVVYVVGPDAYLQRDRSRILLSADNARPGLSVITGKLLSVFGKGEKTLELPTATIGIRGTGCYIETEAGRDYFCLCYGTVDIRSRSHPEQRETLTTFHHDSPLYLSNDGALRMATATVKNHRDDELILLEALVGRLPPFYGKVSAYGSGY